MKIKGTNFENRIVSILNKEVIDSVWKRVVGSGAIGTLMGEGLLTGDMVGTVLSFPRKFRGEAKTGYNSSKNKEIKQFTLKKEWLDKIFNEADATYSVPFLVGHFDGAREGTKDFIVLDLGVFIYIINEYTELKKELDKVYKEIERKDK